MKNKFGTWIKHLVQAMRDMQAAIPALIADLRELRRDNESCQRTMQVLVEAKNLAEAKLVEAEKNSKRWVFLSDYLVGPRTDLDDVIVACKTVAELSDVTDAAIATQEES